MDYQTHKYRLLIPLATVYAQHFTYMEAYRLYKTIMGMLEEAQKDASIMPKALEILKEAHGTFAGLKAHSGWKTMHFIESARQACGGHAYSSYAGLSSLYQDFVVQCTWEGDNTVLTLQAGRYLISCAKKALEGKKNFPAGVEYLNHIPAILTRTFKGDPTSLSNIKEGFDVICANAVLASGKIFKEALSSGQTEDQAFETSAISRFKAARIHCVGYIFKCFYLAVEKAPKELKGILTQLLQLYGLSSMNDNSGLFLQYGFLKPKHLELVNKKVFAAFDFRLWN
jgi:acyl-CoA oxidase